LCEGGKGRKIEINKIFRKIMKIDQDTSLNKYQWLKWTDRIFLILATVMPAFYTLCYYIFIESPVPGQRLNWDVFKWMIFIGPIATLTWFMPILGGILILIGTHLGLSYYIIGLFWGIGMGDYFIIPQYFILIIAGILSIAWGIVRRRERKNKHNNINSGLKER
jgi:hypothetical protein